MLLVHNDQSEPWNRREHRQPCSENDIRLSRLGREPVLRALAFREPAVEGDQPGRCGAAMKEGLKLRGQVDFGHEIEHLTSTGESLFHCPEIDLCLAAAGNALEEPCLESGRIADRSDCLLLVLRERGSLARAPGQGKRCGQRRGERSFVDGTRPEQAPQSRRCAPTKGVKHHPAGLALGSQALQNTPLRGRSCGWGCKYPLTPNLL